MSEYEKAGADRVVDLLARNEQLQTSLNRMKMKVINIKIFATDDDNGENIGAILNLAEQALENET